MDRWIWESEIQWIILNLIKNRLQVALVQVYFKQKVGNLRQQFKTKKKKKPADEIVANQI